MFQLPEAARKDLISYSLESRRPCPELERLINSLYEADKNPESSFQIGIPASQLLRESVLSSKVFKSLLEAFSQRDISKVEVILKKIDRKFFLRYMRTHQATFFRSIILDFFILLDQVKNYIHVDKLDTYPNKEEFNKSKILNFFEEQARESAYILKEMLEALSPSHANPLEEYNEETDLFIQVTDMFVIYIYIYVLKHDPYSEPIEEHEMLENLKAYTPYTSYIMGVLDYWRGQRQLKESPFGEPDLLTKDNSSPRNPIVDPNPQIILSDEDVTPHETPVFRRPEPQRTYGIGEGGHHADEEDHDTEVHAEANADKEDHDTGSINISKEKFRKKMNKKNDSNYLKILIVAFISFAALILVLDTFKAQLSIIIPNIQIILDNLYQSINDIKLFILDLVK